ncbi:MAG: hypothetical protein JXM69_03240, partial [Anaerolineae bacterium]|nr:hypothetical protein [Anaerolineae bacterium]
DAGVNLGYPLDFEDQPVPAGIAPDLGAFEYQSSSEPTLTPTPESLEEIIIDNNDPGFFTSYAQDVWQEYPQDGGQHYDSSHYYNREVGTGQDTATWSFTVPKPGNYDVYAWWWEGSWRPSDVPYTINYAGNSTTVRMDQRINGSQWNLLGTYYFENGGSVTVSDDVSSGQDIVADAIRLVYRSEASPQITPTPEPDPNQITLASDGPTSVNPGETFKVDVVAQNVPSPGLYGVQLELNYNPTLISVGNLQVHPNFTFVVLNSADNTTGKIRLVASQQGRVSGLVGNVTLLSFDATAANAPGVATFTLDNQKASDFQAQGFNLTGQSYNVTIARTVTPEPTAIPTDEPTPEPTALPTEPPTSEPTPIPTNQPTPEPTAFPTESPTPEPTAIPTNEPTPMPTTPATANVSGQVIVIGRADNDWSGSTITIASSNPQSTLTNMTGNFQFAGILAGTHTLTADAPGYLSAVCADVTINTSDTVLKPINLLSGDINDDDIVDITDATAVGAGFSHAGMGLPADITRDGVLDIFDIVLVSVNFGEKGPQTWICLNN